MAGAIPAAGASPKALLPPPIQMRTDASGLDGGRREVVFIDTSVANPETLVNGIGAGIEVQLIGREADGLAQMALWARSHRGYDAIHVVSHGAPGEITLGAGVLDDSVLTRSEVRAELALIGHALRRGGDLFVYGCRVAEGARGRSFVRKVAAATGAHVAASTDPTGSARLGGNWALEYATAEISAPSLEDPGYGALLASGIITFNTVGGTTFGADGIVTDGEGGSSDIAGIVIQVAAVDDSNTIIPGDYLTFHDNSWGVPSIAWENYDGVVLMNYIPYHGMVIQSSGGAEFHLVSFEYVNWGEGSPITIQVKGYRATEEVASTSFTTAPNPDTWQVKTVTLDTFGDVDQVILYSSSPSWHGINTIRIDDPVPPPTTTVSGAHLSTDTGTLGTDWVTYIEPQTISGTLSANLVAGEAVQVSFNNGATWSNATSAVGSNEWSVSTNLSGSNTFRARVYNVGGGGPAFSHSYALDQTGPTITFSALSLSADHGASAADFITDTAAQTITGTLSAALDTGDIVRGSVDAGTNWTDITGKVSGTTLTWNGATLSGSSQIRLSVRDLAGNDGTVTTQAYTLDTTAPTVTSVMRQTPAGSLTNANSLIFRVTFSEGVTAVTTSDFDPTGTSAGATGLSAGSASQYDVTVSGVDLDSYEGTVGLGFAGGQDITDIAGNALSNTTPGTNQTYDLDNTDPGGCAGALSVVENAANGTAVGTVTASDTHSVTYALTDTAGGRFAISAGGAVTVANGSLLDYESATSHSITIRATDAAGNIADAIRDVTITNVNDIAPVITEGAGPLSVTMSEDSTPTAFAQALNATDADGATTFTWTISAAAGHGTASTSGTGTPMSISYVPNSNYNGSDHFTVQVSDGGGNTDSIHIDVTIEAVNDAPIIDQGASTSFSTAEDTPHDLTLDGTDVDGQPLDWTLTAAPAHGGVGFAGGPAASKTFTYTPAANYNGEDQFTLRVSDGIATDSITVNVTVTAANDAPVITEGAGPLAVTMSEDSSPTAFAQTLNATDADSGTTLTWSISTGANHGTASASGTGASKSISYTPDADYNGSDYFIVRVSDGTATDSVRINVTIEAVDDAPVINQGASTSFSTAEDTSHNLTLTGTEVDGQAISWSVSSAPSHGDTTVPAGTGTSKTITYTPDADYNGADSFVVTASDGSLTDTITVNVTVNAVNDAPVINEGASTSFITAEDTAHGVDLTATEPESQAVSWSVSSAPNHGAATVPAGTGTSKTVTYTPAANYNGLDTFVIAASDGSASNTITVNVTITAADDPPAINQGASTTLTVLEDSSSVRTLSATEPDGEAVTWGVSVAPAHGGVLVPGGAGPSKGYTYTPDDNYTGTDTFRATATDGTSTDTIDVNVTVTPVNDEPEFVAGGDVNLNSDSGAAYIGAGWAMGLSAGPADEAGQLLTFVASNDNHALFSVQPYVDSTGALRFTPVASAAGTATVTLYLTDNGGTAHGGDNRSSSVTFDITLTSTGIPAPVFSPAGGTYKGRAEVTLTASTPGATIRYTTDGTTPSETNGTEVASGTTIILIQNTHLSAVAYASGRPHSAVTEADYRIKGGSGALEFGGLFALAILALRRRRTT